MPSLTQLLTEHRNLLVLDAASTRIQVGLLRPTLPACWQATPQDSGSGLFSAVEACLRDAGLSLASVEAFVFCAGPGSMLGVRTVAIALRTWQALHSRPAYAYQSLALAGVHEWVRKEPRAFTVVADARRETWHAQRVNADGSLPALQRVTAPEVPEGELTTPENFRAWGALPRPASACTYDLAKILPSLEKQDLFHEMEFPDAFQHEAPTYKKWSAQIHRPAAANSK
jgi:tRNA threonylcarbamoyladenosine biosynthesis protein TsaB